MLTSNKRVDEFVNDQLVALELISLNNADLDVEELERRLELTATIPGADCWNDCPNLNVCVLCSQNVPWH